MEVICWTFVHHILVLVIYDKPRITAIALSFICYCHSYVLLKNNDAVKRKLAGLVPQLGERISRQYSSVVLQLIAKPVMLVYARFPFVLNVPINVDVDVVMLRKYNVLSSAEPAVVVVILIVMPVISNAYANLLP
jgi:hypothetical protein